MSVYVALLRGVNVGKAKRVPMASLRTLLAGLGYREVQTLLNSGNAVFHATETSGPALAKAISAAILEQLAVDVPVIVKSAQQLHAIISENPFTAVAPNHARLLVAFTQDDESLPSLRSLEALVTPSEGFFVGQHAAYLHCADGILESKAGEALLGKLGKTTTTRNWATTLKLHALVVNSREHD